MLDALLDLGLGSTCAACGWPGRILCTDCEGELPRRPMSFGPVASGPGSSFSGLAPVLAADWYAGGLRALVLAHKERRALALRRPLGRVLADVLAGLVAAVPERTCVVLVPVPSRPATVRARGHDPVLRMVRVAARRLSTPLRPVLVSPLLRQRAVVADQAGLGATEREANLAGRLGVRARHQRRLVRAGVPVTVVVCDDVLTTGATAREAQRALVDAGIPVTAIGVLAVTRRRHGAENQR